MPRTTSSAVKDILLKDYDDINEPDLLPFIESASVVISRVIECATHKGITISVTEAEILERWLSAHFYVQSDASYKQRSTLRASGAFNKDWDSYLKVAYSIDPSGCLQAAIESKRVRGFWLGKRPSQQTDYVDRE